MGTETVDRCQFKKRLEDLIMQAAETRLTAKLAVDPATRKILVAEAERYEQLAAEARTMLIENGGAS